MKKRTNQSKQISALYKSLLSVCRIKGPVSSGGYSNSGSQGKEFQKLMFSKKGVSVFSPKIKVLSKKKSLHFDFISDFPILFPKSRCSPKKRRSSL